jgi:integrase
MREACEACGFRYGREVAGGFVTHDGRHTAVTRMLHAGKDLATIGLITGHNDKTLILHYGHATAESGDAAIGC